MGERYLVTVKDGAVVVEPSVGGLTLSAAFRAACAMAGWGVADG